MMEDAEIQQNEKKPLTMERIVSLLDTKDYGRLKQLLSLTDSPDLAELLEDLSPSDRIRAFRLLPKEMAAEVFVELLASTQLDIIGSYTDRELSEILEELYLDDTVDIIEEMPANVVKRILRSTTAQNRTLINRLLRYPKNSAGSIMTTEYVRFRPDMSVKDALTHIRRVAIDKETIYTCYITDEKHVLIGIVSAKTLLISPLETRLFDIMEKNFISLHTAADREEVAHRFEKYGFLAMPVTDGEGRLVGIVTVDDAMDVLHEENEEDFAKMAAITPSETPYLRSSPFSIFKARIPWLLILMISATFSSMILGFFESVLPAVLILFVPMLMDTGGNSGGQSSVTVTRGISLGEITPKDTPRVLAKEIFVGTLSGVSLGSVAFLKIMLIDRLLMNNPAVTVTVSLAVSVTLALTIVTAKTVGALLPILAKRIGFDPAVMASPFITTTVDVISLLMFYLISAHVFGL